MDDARPRRHHTEVAERLLPPAQELVAFAVASVFDVHVLLQRVGDTILVDLHGVVDHHIGLDLGIDDFGVPAQILHRIAHGGEIDDARHAGEVLHHHSGRRELDLMAGLCGRIPVEQGLDVIVGDVGPIDVAHQIFNQHLQ